MCMFTGEIADVNGTEIFTILLPHGLQYTQYKNTVKLPNNRDNRDHSKARTQTTLYCPPESAMILPVPVGMINYDLPINKCRETDASLSSSSTTSLSSSMTLKTGEATGQTADRAVKELFEAAERCFPVYQRMQSRSIGMNDDDDCSDSFASKTLKVEKMGQFWVSVADTVSDLSRFSREKFTIDETPTGVLNVIKSRYAVGFSFLIFQLKDGGENHPFGYIHETLPGGDCFIPTFHHHPRSHPTSRLSSSSTLIGSNDSSSDAKGVKTPDGYVETLSDDWDHKIYSLVPRIPAAFLSSLGPETSETALPSPTGWKLEFLDARPKLTTISRDFVVDSFTPVITSSVRVFHDFLSKWVGQIGFSSDDDHLWKSNWLIHKIEVKGNALNGDIILSTNSTAPSSSSSSTELDNLIGVVANHFGKKRTERMTKLQELELPTMSSLTEPMHPSMSTFDETIFSTPHYGIVCDGCQARNLRSPVYKCMSCLDVDFCAACVSFNVHLSSRVGGHLPHHKLQLVGHPLDKIKHVANSSSSTNNNNSSSSNDNYPMHPPQSQTFLPTVRPPNFSSSAFVRRPSSLSRPTDRSREFWPGPEMFTSATKRGYKHLSGGPSFPGTSHSQYSSWH